MAHKRGHKTRRTRRGGESVMTAVRRAQAAASAATTERRAAEENKKLVAAADAYDPFGPSPSPKVDIVNPAVERSLKKTVEDSYGKADGFATRVAARLEADTLTKRGKELDPAARGGKKTRKLRKGMMVRRICAVIVTPVGATRRRRKH